MREKWKRQAARGPFRQRGRFVLHLNNEIHLRPVVVFRSVGRLVPYPVAGSPFPKSNPSLASWRAKFARRLRIHRKKASPKTGDPFKSSSVTGFFWGGDIFFFRV